MIRTNREIIQSMDKEATIDIETAHLKVLCSIAEKYGGAAKTSGAAVVIVVLQLSTIK